MTTTTGKDRARILRAVLGHGAGVLLAILLLPVVAIGVPFAAWAIAFVLVVLNRVVHGAVVYLVRDASLTVALGSVGFSTIFRALLTALTLFFVGASIGANGDRPVGLDRPDLAMPAIILFMVCFTLDAGIEAIRRAQQREHLNHTGATTRESAA
jgi:hypothetical protein